MNEMTTITPFRSAARPTLILGLSVAVELHAATFRPQYAQHGLPLFGDLRWAGWASALTAGYADQLIVVGGIERLDDDACPPGVGWPCKSSNNIRCVPRGLAACHALASEYGVDKSRLDWRYSEGNTGGNASTIRQLVDKFAPSHDVIISTNHYHLPRAQMDIHAAGVSGIPAVPAEAYWLAEKTNANGLGTEGSDKLIQDFGGGPLATRTVAEIKGIADKINRRYCPLSA